MQAIKRVSERAIAWLYTQALPPSPQNYWLAFACLDGQHAELSRTLDALLDGGVRLKQVEADALYEQFFGRAATAQPQLKDDEESTDALRHQTLRLADLAASAQAVTGEFSRELESLPGPDAPDPIDVRALIGVALERAQRSERELARTTAEVEQLRQKLETVRGDAERDALTGLPNRRGIDAHLAKLCKKGTPGVLALCDVDRFKTYNDRYGHAVGDRVLKTVAQSLTESLDGHFVGRWGGEEFLVVATLPLDDGAAAVRRAKDELGHRHFKLRETDEPMGRITFSAGVVALPGAAAEVEAAIARADALLYQAKEGGRDLVLSA
jgi:diguanylate cyclase